MSLRAVPAKLYLIRCDTCGVETAGSLMPVEAELRAAEGGWRTGKNPLRHLCPWCIEKGSTPLAQTTSTVHTTTPPVGR
ncbi:MAG: hypothetical protein WC969_14930 [Elusimicrobiota bacterium]|jgi:uncharacterized protein CbrC (UPF0167 family)